VLLSTARRPGRAPGGDLPGQLRLEAIFCEHRSTLLAELCRRWDVRHAAAAAAAAGAASSPAGTPAAVDAAEPSLAAGGGSSGGAGGESAGWVEPSVSPGLGASAAASRFGGGAATVECPCCYDDVPQVELGACSGNRRHQFCLECVATPNSCPTR
jgi:hypothetical protein